MGRIKSKITFANITASIALFVVLGGTAFGLARNTVGPKAIKANAVRTSKIAGAAVTTDKLADGAVTTPKLGDNAATGAKVDESTLGQVPSAAAADTATSATSAANAANADKLETRPLQRVVSEVTDDSFASDKSVTIFQSVLATNAAAQQAAPADIVAQASLSFYGDADATADCHMEIDLGAGFVPLGVFSLASVGDTDNGESASMSLVGLYNNAPGGIHPVRVMCREFSGNAIIADSGSLVVTVVPE